MNFGGPVWHVSIRHRDIEMAKKIAYAELDGVGDATLGEWTDFYTAFHLRRRLSRSEQELVGPILDIRGTSEAWRRFEELPAAIRKIVGQPL